MDDLAIAAIINESEEVSTASLATTTTFLNWSSGGTLLKVAWRLRKIKNTYLITGRVYKFDN
jgi:hypothetical protein